MCNDVSDFYFMMTEFYNANPVSGLRLFEKRECNNLGSKGDVEDDISDSEDEAT